MLRGYLLSDPYNTVALTWKDRFEQLSVKNHDTDSAYLKDLVDTPEKVDTEYFAANVNVSSKPSKYLLDSPVKDHTDSAKITKKSAKYGTKK